MSVVPKAYSILYYIVFIMLLFDYLFWERDFEAVICTGLELVVLVGAFLVGIVESSQGKGLVDLIKVCVNFLI